MAINKWTVLTVPLRRYVDPVGWAMKVLARLLALVVAGCLLAGSAWADQSPGQASVASTNEVVIEDGLVARVVYGILSYSYWPDDKALRTLCAVGPSRYTAVLEASASTQLRERITFRFSSVDEVIGQQPCDAIYIGHLAAQQLNRLLKATAGKPVVTILEHSQYCDEGALICLQAQSPGVLSFQVNLDAVSLSQVRVSPQVLKMSKGLVAPRRAP